MLRAIGYFYITNMINHEELPRLFGQSIAVADVMNCFLFL